MLRIFDDKGQADELYNQIVCNKGKLDQVHFMNILKKFVVVFIKATKHDMEL